MMKELLILLIALSLLLCSCTGVTESASHSDETESIDDMSEEDTEPLDNTSYEDIERRRATGYQIKYFGFQKDSVLLKTKYPTEWSLRASDEGFELIRDGKSIGYLLGGPADDTAAWTVLNTESRSANNIRITKHIEQKNGCKAFRYRYVYDYMSDGYTRTFTLTASYEEVDKKTETRLYKNAVMVDKFANIAMGALSDFLTEPSSILILGNSFIGTSDIGNILGEMLRRGGKDCTVNAISRGYANVGTYTNDRTLLESIRKGKYDAVFICGFYANTEVTNLGILKEACDQSMTKLVIFPAHNESAPVITLAQRSYPSLFCLDWREELDALIKNGVNRWALCIDDAHKHSTPLAGYVGAHMIYRAIYNELPTEPMRDTLSQQYIDGILGDYAYVGDMCVLNKDRITYLN